MTGPVRVCRDCYPLIDDNNNNTSKTVESPSSNSKSSMPMAIQNGCREPNGTPNGSFNSTGGQKVKG